MAARVSLAPRAMAPLCVGWCHLHVHPPYVSPLWLCIDCVCCASPPHDPFGDYKNSAQRTSNLVTKSAILHQNSEEPDRTISDRATRAPHGVGPDSMRQLAPRRR